VIDVEAEVVAVVAADGHPSRPGFRSQQLVCPASQFPSRPKQNTWPPTKNRHGPEPVSHPTLQKSTVVTEVVAVVVVVTEVVAVVAAERHPFISGIRSQQLKIFGSALTHWVPELSIGPQNTWVPNKSRHGPEFVSHSALQIPMVVTEVVAVVVAGSGGGGGGAGGGSEGAAPLHLTP